MVMDLIDTIEGIFTPGGSLSQVLPGYESRAQQTALAVLLADGLESGEHAIAEAQTGVGKSLAYLVALRASGQRAIVSTHTKALQLQLADKDGPTLQQLFPGTRIAVLKGRANYVCLLELGKVESDATQAGGQLALFGSRLEADSYGLLRAWLRTPEGADGDLDRAPFGLPDRLREQLTVDGQSCVGRKCPAYGECYAQQAKAAAAAADIVIVNHRLLLLDLALAELTNGEVHLLPDLEVVVIDEAHHLQDVATDTFGAELTAGRWASLLRRVRRLCTELTQRNREAEVPVIPGETLERIEDQAEATAMLAEDWCADLLVALGEAKARELSLLLVPALRASGDTLATRTRQLMQSCLDIGDRLANALHDTDEHEAVRWHKVADTAQRLTAWLGTALRPAVADEAPLVRAVERAVGRGGERAVVSVRLVSVAERLRELLWERRRVLAVSATLASGARFPHAFDYWRTRVGLEGGLARVIPSPFPYRERVRTYVPAEVAAFDPGTPAHKSPEGQEAYEHRVMARLAELLAVRRGGAFGLFTSVRMLRRAALTLEGRVDSLLLVQGDAPPAELVRRFKADGHAILLGTRTFWEGVDVPGEALQLVLIDKLAFAVPDDPLWQARVRLAGDRWFTELALPMALMALKQAYGRLMRRMDDTGVVGILDTRLLSKSYGRGLLQALPPAPLVRSVAEVQAFLQRGGD